MKQIKQLSIFIALLVVLTAAAPASADEHLIVDNGNPACDDASGTPFCTIQAAVDAASSGDTIHVAGEDFDNVYHESVVIYKDGLTLIGHEFPVVTAFSATETAVLITANDINVQGFAIGFNEVGILLYDVERVGLSHNIVGFNVEAGIVAAEGDQNGIAENLVFGQGGPAVLLIQETESFVGKNTAVLSGHWDETPEPTKRSAVEAGQQLKIAAEKYATLANPTSLMGQVQQNQSKKTNLNMSSPFQWTATKKATVADTTEAAPPSGILLYQSSEIYIYENELAANLAGGILLVESHNNNLEANGVALNGLFGIGLGRADENIVHDNEIGFNFGVAGIWVESASKGNLLDSNHIVWQHGPLDDDSAAGIRIDGDGNHASNNQVHFNSHYGFVINGNENMVGQNEAIGNGHATRERTSLDAPRQSLQVQKSSRYSGSGFLVYGSLNQLEGNQAWGNQGDGFRLGDSVLPTGNLLFANGAAYNEESGFVLGGEANIVTANHGFYNAGYGFEAVENNEYIDNQCGHNGLGSSPIACIE